MMHPVWIAELKLEAYNSYWSLVRVAGGDDKLNLDSVRSVEINCKCASDSFEGIGFVCWPSRDCVSILPRSCVDFFRSAQAEIVCRFRQVFVGVRLRFEKSSQRWRIIGREKKILLKRFVKLC